MITPGISPCRRRFVQAFVVAAGVLLAAPALRAQDERPLEDWFRRIHVSGNADVAYLIGQENSLADNGRFLVDNARLFLDVDLGRDIAPGGHLLAEDASFLVEMNLVHQSYGYLDDRIGSLYVRFDGVAGLGGLNVKIGRFLVPFGEEYLRKSEGRPDNPFVTFSVAEPYGWDEGLLLFGALFDRRVEYFLSATNGDADAYQTSGSGLAVSAKLKLRPLPWLEISASGLRTGRLGDYDNTAHGAFSWSRVDPQPFGYGSGTQSFADGAPSPTDPSRSLKDVLAGEADLMLHSETWGRLWLAAGAVTIESHESAFYTRRLRYGIAEGILELGGFSADLDAFYLAARASFIGTLDSDRGYFVGSFNDGEDLGYNTRLLSAVSLGFGFRMSRAIVFKVEATWNDVDLVRGVTSDLEDEARRKSFAGIGVSIQF